MWEIYDKLTEGLTSDIFVRNVSVGSAWTAVTLSNGNVGIAMTTDVQTVGRTAPGFTGMSLKEAAAYIKSWNFLEASIAAAAINAWYNSPERLEKTGGRQADKRFCTFGFDVKNKNVVMVGRMRSEGSGLEEAKSLIVLERDAKEGTYPDSACEYVIPDSDMVIITGSALINKTLPRLLQLANMPGKKRTVILTGPSVPMSEELLRFGIDRLAGLVVTDGEAMVRFAAGNLPGPPYETGERFCLNA